MAPNNTQANQSNLELRNGYDKPLSVYLRQTSVKSEPAKKPIIFQKSIVVLFASLAAFIMFLLRYNLSVAIIGMAEETIVISSMDNDTLTNSTTSLKYRFSWHNNENEQGLILG